jgi:hypothetical protein
MTLLRAWRVNQAQARASFVRKFGCRRGESAQTCARANNGPAAAQQPWPGSNQTVANVFAKQIRARSRQLFIMDKQIIIIFFFGGAAADSVSKVQTALELAD